jgi:hypothetical protein
MRVRCIHRTRNALQGPKRRDETPLDIASCKIIRQHDLFAGNPTRFEVGNDCTDKRDALHQLLFTGSKIGAQVGRQIGDQPSGGRSGCRALIQGVQR